MQALEKLKPLALLLLRCALGAIFIYHGFPKLFGQTQRFVTAFANLGLPGWTAYVAGVIELFGGALLILGLFTRVVGLLLTAHMGVAMWKFNLSEGWMALREYELPLVLAITAFTLATVGAGVISLDHAISAGKGGGRGAGKARSKD